jgi:hypothetical protein
MRECADVSITKQPGNLRNRQGLVGEMTPGEIKLEPLYDSGKRQLLRRKPPCKRSLAYAQFAGDDTRLRVSMWQQASNDVFNAQSKGTGLHFSGRNCFLAVLD